MALIIPTGISPPMMHPAPRFGTFARAPRFGDCSMCAAIFPGDDGLSGGAVQLAPTGVATGLSTTAISAPVQAAPYSDGLSAPWWIWILLGFGIGWVIAEHKRS